MGILSRWFGRREIAQALDKLDPIVKPKLAKLLAKEIPALAPMAPQVADKAVDLLQDLLVEVL